jgi:light-regulated signal transduction histidine kinase (bacteriophytochrome)
MNASTDKIEKIYTEALREFLLKKDEGSLQRAYAVGRQVILDEASLLEIVTIHHDFVRNVISTPGGGETNQQIIRMAGDFLRETLASFEMVRRGHKETLEALRRRTQELDETNRRLFELNQTLEEKVTEKTAAAEKKARELSRVNNEMEQFVHAAAHDLKEPLRTITSYVQLLEMTDPQFLQGDARDYIGFVVQGTHRLQQLIDDLLSYTRLNAVVQPPRPVDMAQIFRETLSNLESVIREKKAEVTSGELPVVYAQHAHMVLLLQNLVSNGLKFRREKPPKIHVQARRGAEEWIFSVSDNGIGIDAKYFNKLFVVFQRLNTADTYPGTGIGLALCRKIVEQGNGKIWLESAVGKGSVFYFSIPFGEGS